MIKKSCNKSFVRSQKNPRFLAKLRTLVLLVERTVATPPAEGVGLGVPLTVERSAESFFE